MARRAHIASSSIRALRPVAGRARRDFPQARAARLAPLTNPGGSMSSHRSALGAVVFIGIAAAAGAKSLAPQVDVPSPDGRIVVNVSVVGGAHYEVRHDGRTILRASRLGVVRDDADFTRDVYVTKEYAAGKRAIDAVED